MAEKVSIQSIASEVLKVEGLKLGVCDRNVLILCFHLCMRIGLEQTLFLLHMRSNSVIGKIETVAALFVIMPAHFLLMEIGDLIKINLR